MNQTVPIYSSIANPKRHLDPAETEGRKLFPYYAGFSGSFVESILDTINLSPKSVVLDPWNGSGTTTSTALKRGFSVIGSDLNPAMVIAAKAALISKFDIESLIPLAASIVKKAVTLHTDYDLDPLYNWFDARSAAHIRNIEFSINNTLVSHAGYLHLDTSSGLDKVTPLAAFFYLALFRAVRRLTIDFVASNPTWIKVGKTPEEKKSVSRETIAGLFIKEVEILGGQHKINTLSIDLDMKNLSLILSNAESLPLPADSVDAIITSPPYCTRIDYAIATYIELAIIRVDQQNFAKLRRELTGSSTVPKNNVEGKIEWGTTCLDFLEKLKNHPSKASRTYYLKNHTQYFDSLYKSLAEASRVLSTSGPCVLVVQNSYYKEIRNDVALIIKEMTKSMGLKLNHQADFIAARSMVGLNKKSKQYLEKRHTVESVLVLEKTTPYASL